MCGIAGFVESRAHWSPIVLQEIAAGMVDRLAHRGPDDRGVWEDSACGIALASRRLAILDLSSAGHQPMQSRSGRFVLAHNGEVYNFVELRQEVESHEPGSRWVGHSDTEVMLACFECWGVRGG